MKNNIWYALLLLMITTPSFAHFLWIDTPSKGTIGKEQEIQVFFGEYTSGVWEKTEGEVFQDAEDFTMWVVAPDGSKIELSVVQKELSFSTNFTPKMEGTYTVIVDNKNYKVLDYTEYDYGIFRPQYHATSKIDVGTGTKKNTASVNPSSLSIVDISKVAYTQNATVDLQVVFKGKPLADAEVTIFIKDEWSKKMKTDSKGIISFSLPWNADYIVEATHEDKIPGTFQEKPYQFTWHCAVYTIKF
ncbi:DUF4198 domain-containing protein [Aquimarina sp. W85]|uniref:DUF4198 domain-containing protein n=1 Tax=Aquimarina rhodophyticola TaxID=3342246 RepID=UPI00366EC7B8